MITKVIEGYTLVKVSSLNLDVDTNVRLWMWMNGQTSILVEEDDEPFGWIFLHDYNRFVENLPIID